MVQQAIGEMDWAEKVTRKRTMDLYTSEVDDHREETKYVSPRRLFLAKRI